MTALEHWVEDDVAPEQLAASHTALAFPENVMTDGTQQGDFSRPLCPWPEVARWTGHGSASDAANFVCSSKHGCGATKDP